MIVIDGTAGITTSNITISTGAGTTNITSSGISTPHVSAIDSSSKIPGEIFKFAGSVAPAGCLACPTVQTLVSTSSYPNLFTAIGYTWGGTGTSFGIPYFPAGYSAVQGTPGVATVGAVIAHTHAYNAGAGPGVGTYGYYESPSYSYSPSNAISAAGGANNLAAGMGVMYCVKT